MDTVDNCKNPGWNTFITEKTQPGMKLEKTNLFTLNDYCKNNNITKIDFIKIDTEGYEFEILLNFAPDPQPISKISPFLQNLFNKYLSLSLFKMPLMKRLTLFFVVMTSPSSKFLSHENSFFILSYTGTSGM